MPNVIKSYEPCRYCRDEGPHEYGMTGDVTWKECRRCRLRFGLSAPSISVRSARHAKGADDAQG